MPKPSCVRRTCVSSVKLSNTAISCSSVANARTVRMLPRTSLALAEAPLAAALLSDDSLRRNVRMNDPPLMMRGTVSTTPMLSCLEIRTIEMTLPSTWVMFRSPCETTCLNELLNVSTSEERRSVISPIWCESKNATSCDSSA